MKKSELIAPAGSLKKLKYALAFGADAVYLGLPDFSLRARVNEFNLVSIKSGIDHAHKLDKKVYLTVNIYAHDRHLKKLEEFIKKAQRLQPDAYVISDPGVSRIIKKNDPKAKIHLSTQANTTNWQAAKFWYDLGVKRIILARELTLKEITAIHQKVPKLELETFVHGAMCMAYSGRCILSKWMTGRSANLGDCAHSCRWRYKMSNDQCQMSNKIQMSNDQRLLAPELSEQRQMINEFQISNDQIINKSWIQNSDLKKMLKYQNSKIVFLEETERPGEIIPVEEDEHGTYIFNSKDLCLIDYLPELQRAGVQHFKIEGRAKSIYYLAVVVKAYREAIDKGKKLSKSESRIMNYELRTLTNRDYHIGFLFGKDKFEHLFDRQQIRPDYMLVGEVLKCPMTNDKCQMNVKTQTLNDDEMRNPNFNFRTSNPELQIPSFDDLKNYETLILVHNVLNIGDKIEAIIPGGKNVNFRVKKMVDVKTGREVKAARGGREQKVIISLIEKLPEYTVLRKKI